jgi:uncharacterized membrane protein YkoI
MTSNLTVLACAAALGLLVAGQAGAKPPNADQPPAAQGQPSGGGSLGADWRQQQDEVRELRRQRRLIPMGEIIEKIRRLNPGPRSQQLDAGLEYQGDRPVYRLRWMTNDGRRIDYIVDAVTGLVLSGG